MNKQITAKSFLTKVLKQLQYISRNNIDHRGHSVEFIVKVQKLNLWMNAYGNAPESSHLGYLKSNSDLIRSLIPSRQKNTIEELNQIINTK